MKKVGLALGSGGARGYAHIGVIKSLRKNNIPIDYIAGTSMGAIIAAYYALHLDISGLEKIALDFKKMDMLKVIDVNNPKVSIVKGQKAKDFLRKILGKSSFNDTKIPLRIGTTALEDGSKIILDKGNIVDAIMMSSAFPGVFPPVKYSSKHFVDGGLADATPIDLVKDIGAEVVIAVDLFSLDYYKKRPYEKMSEVLERTYEIIMARLSEYSMKEYGENIVLIKPKTGKDSQTFDFYNAKKNIKSGEAETHRHIEKIKELIA